MRLLMATKIRNYGFSGGYSDMSVMQRAVSIVQLDKGLKWET